MSTQNKYSILAFFSCLILGFLIYFNSLDVPFYLDDFRNVSENPYTRISRLTPSNLFDAAFKSPSWTRPIPNLSFALNFYFHQENVLGYHFVNIFVHIITGFLVFKLAVVTFLTPSLASKYKNIHYIALFAALLWLVHPLHTQSVTYIVQRMNSMATMFYVLSLWGYVKGRLAQKNSQKWTYFAGSFIAALFAYCSKEISVTLPFIIFLYEWYFFQGLNKKWLLRKSWLLLIFVIFLIILFWLYIGSPIVLLSSYDYRNFSVFERIFTEFRVVIFYLSLLCFPHPERLNIDHDFVLSTSMVSPITTLISFIIIIILMIISIISAKKYRLFSFSILWYLINLSLESSFIGLEVIFEHRTYLPSIFLIIAFVTILYHYITIQYLTYLFLFFSIILCSFWTVIRNDKWKDPVVFWEDSVRKSPDKARPYINLSVAYRDIGKYDKSIETAEKAIQIDPKFLNGFVSLGTTYHTIGEYDKAIELFQLTLSKKPDYYEVYTSLGNAYLKKGNIEHAIEAFRTNLKYNPKSYKPLVNLASIKASKGMIHEAIIDFQKAVELSGNNPDILFNLALAYTRVGNDPKAIEVYRELLRISPDDNEAKVNLRKLYEKNIPRNHLE